MSRGYTLLEVVAGLSLLAIVLIGALAFIDAHSSAVRDLYEERAALEAVQGQIERFRAEGEPVGRGRQAITIKSASLRSLKDAAAFVEGTEDGRVRVTLQWRSIQGAPRSVSAGMVAQ